MVELTYNNCSYECTSRAAATLQLALALADEFAQADALACLTEAARLLATGVAEVVDHG